MAKDQQLKKVLRIGIIQDGKIVQERLIKAGEPVTVGESAKNTFVFPKTRLPASEFILFSFDGSAYALHVTEHMRGKISAGGGVVALDRVRADQDVKRDGPSWKVPLSEQDRGKISIDGVTVLFQFVPPPPVQAVRPIEAMDFRPRMLDEDDPLFLGFLAVWSALGAVLLVWVTTADPIVIEAQEIPDRFVRLAVQKDSDKETPDPEIQDDNGTTVKREEKQKAKKAEPSENKAKKASESKVEQARRKEDLAQEIRKQSAFVKMIGTRGNSADTVAGFWDSDDATAGDLDSLMRNVDGARVADGTEHGPREGGGTSNEDVDIGSLAQAGGGTAEVGSGPAVQVKGDVSMGSGDISSVEGADSVPAVVKNNFGQLKYCYETRLKSNPSLSGRVEVEWNVARSRVTSANVYINTTGDQEFANCIIRKIKGWSFPDDVQGEIVYPFIFTPSK